MNKLVLNQVTKVYGDGNETIVALDSASLSVKEGEFVGVIGPSGSGKSTFLSIAGALLQPSEGAVTIGDVELSSLNDKQLAEVRLQKIGFILQTANLVPYLNTVDQLVLMRKLAGSSKAEDKERAKELLSELGLSHRFKNFPHELSGGERQRIAIARAFMNNPEIILADEPTANLDSKRGEEVVAMLANEVKKFNKAAIMVTHDERMLTHCDRVVKIVDGKII